MSTVWIINQYASTPETGMGGRHFYLAEELAKQGHTVYLIAGSANHLLHTQPVLEGNFTFSKQAGFNFVWVKILKYPHAHSKKRVMNWFLFPWHILKLAKVIPNKPDAVLCSSPSLFDFLAAERLAKNFKARLLFEVRDIWPLTLIELGGYSKNHPFIRLLQWVEDRAYLKSDKVLSNLKNAVYHMEEHGLQREKFTWIPNGFSLREVNEKQQISQEIKNELPQKKFIVGYTGTFGLANDLYTLVDSAVILKEHEDISFVLVGGGREKKDLEEYIKSKKITNVILIDQIPKTQIQSMLENFDVLTVGVKKEPMYRFGVSPNKLFDYLYAGKPIIYHIDSGDFKPVNDAHCGFEVEPQNPQAIADAILKLYKMPAKERIQLGENGRKAAMAEYEYGILAKKLATVLFDQ